MSTIVNVSRAARPQLPLFDSDITRVPEIADVHAYSRPAKTFTGDFYFTHRYEDRLWFALGDVAGKGLPAALVMAMIQEELEHRIEHCALTRRDPASTTLRLHTFLKPLLPSNRFATAVVGHLCSDGQLLITNAGHTPVLISRRNGLVERIGSTGPVVGILASPSWRSSSVRLHHGDALLLYSDGLLEAESPEGTQFGGERIEQLFGATKGDARERVNAMVEAVDRFAAGKLQDDLTIVAVQY